MGNISYDDASLSPKAKAWLQKHEAILAGHLPTGEFVWEEQPNRIRLMQRKKVGGMNSQVECCGFYSSHLDSDPVDKILKQIALEFPPAQPS